MGAYALLVGISEFKDPRLAKLNAPKGDVEALARVLKDPARGGFDNVDTCIDQDLQTVRDRLAALLDDRSPDDMVLLYYSGHGIMTRGQRLFLATGGSDFDRPQARSLAAVEMRDMLEQSRAGKQVVILDCCHSGAFVDGAKGVAQTVTADTFGSDSAEGQYVLTATDALQFAYDATGALRDSAPEPALSRFTSWLVDAVGKGEAAPDKDRITLDAVFDYLSRRARVEAAGMTPRRFVKRNSGEMVIAKNPAVAPAQLPDALMAGLDAKEWQARRDAVLQLGKLAEQPALRDLIEQAVTDRVSLERDVDVRSAMLGLLRRIGTPAPSVIAPPEARPEPPRMKPAQAAPMTPPRLRDPKPAEAEPDASWGAVLGRVFLAPGFKRRRNWALGLTGAGVALLALAGTFFLTPRVRDIPAGESRTTDARVTGGDVLNGIFDNSDAGANAANAANANAAEPPSKLSKAATDDSANLAAKAESTNAAGAFPSKAQAPDVTGKRAPDEAEAKRKAAAAEAAKRAEAANAANAANKEVASVEPPSGATKASSDLFAFIRGKQAEAQARNNPGFEFKECAECPVMISLPAGTFAMGSPPPQGIAALFGGDGRDEQPQHDVTIATPFSVGKFEVTFAEWDACVADGGCGGYRPPDEGWGRGNHPVVNVSWNDAQSYIAWLRNKTGKPYRLLSEAEWEYAARGATVSDFYWGANENKAFAKYDSSDGTAPVGTYRPNSFGLFDMAGNVNEWAADCNNDSYNGAPKDGSAWMTGKCNLHALRGGGWNSPAANLRSANRDWDAAGFRVNRNGFRVARGL